MWLETGLPTIEAATSHVVVCGSSRWGQACRWAPARNARSGRWTSPRRSRRFSGSRWWNPKASRSPSWRSEGGSSFNRAKTMQFNAGLTGEAATLARQHGEMLARLPGTVHAFILVELQKWRMLFGPEQRYQRALLEDLSRLPRRGVCQAAS